MTDKKKPPTEDPEQSRRFLDLARELEDAGELIPTDGEKAFERAMGRIAPAKRPSAPGRGKP